MATWRGYRIGSWLAGRLMKELELVSCHQPTHRYIRGGHEHLATRAAVRSDRAKLGVVRRREVYLDR